MLRIGQIVIGVQDMERALAFWSQALGYTVRRSGDDDWHWLHPAEGTHGPTLALGLSESPVEPHPRVHLDLFAADAAEQAAEVERLVALGAVRVDWDLYPDDPDFVVLADTEGNRFCVIDVTHG
ncbi:VOC family protein [Nonomuraea sp. NPDC046570]|uniref:VOC family protein n=1 Tax=Nonomuraea sp. NPDC046570 TaxID=3155255 RepID=UPI0033D581B0